MAKSKRYLKKYVKTAAEMCKLGATDQNLADAFGISVRTLGRWKVEHKEFWQALKTNKSAFDDQVEAALFQRAMGYSCEETKIHVIDDKIVETTVTKHYPPESRAALAWLYNRRGKYWHPKPTDEDEDNVPEPQKITIEVVDARKKEG